MSKELAFELFGYLGSVLVLVSMLMTSVVRLRVINLIGSAIFAAYAILIHSYPTALLNGCLVGVNVYHLLRLRREAPGGYEIQPLGPGESFTAWFLDRYRADAVRFFPPADVEAAQHAEGFAVFYDDRAAGVLLGHRRGERFEILLDYSTPSFRDCSVGAFLYAELPRRGITVLSCKTDSPEHLHYMEKMGFLPQTDGSFLRELTPAGE